MVGILKAAWAAPALTTPAAVAGIRDEPVHRDGRRSVRKRLGGASTRISATLK
jgi:hypothetical protein